MAAPGRRASTLRALRPVRPAPPSRRAARGRSPSRSTTWPATPTSAARSSEPDAAWAGNLTATRSLYEAVSRWGGRPRILFVGSGLVYGDADDARPAVRREQPAAARQPLRGQQGGRRPGQLPVRPSPRAWTSSGPGRSTTSGRASRRSSPSPTSPGRSRPSSAAGSRRCWRPATCDPRRDLTDVRDMVRGLRPAHGARPGRRGVQRRHRPDAMPCRRCSTGCWPWPGCRSRCGSSSDLVRARPIRSADPGRCRASCAARPAGRRAYVRWTRRWRDTLDLSGGNGSIMKIAVIGTGYVGLVTGTCLAESGNDVVGIDKDAAQDRRARSAASCPSTSRACWSWCSATAARAGCASPPTWPAGIAPAQIDLHRRRHAAGRRRRGRPVQRLGRRRRPGRRTSTGPKIVVIKSTVPVGTNRALAERLAASDAGTPSTWPAIRSSSRKGPPSTTS